MAELCGSVPLSEIPIAQQRQNPCSVLAAVLAGSATVLTAHEVPTETLCSS